MPEFGALKITRQFSSNGLEVVPRKAQQLSAEGLQVVCQKSRPVSAEGLQVVPDSSPEVVKDSSPEVVKDSSLEVVERYEQDEKNLVETPRRRNFKYQLLNTRIGGIRLIWLGIAASIFVIGIFLGGTLAATIVSKRKDQASTSAQTT